MKNQSSRRIGRIKSMFILPAVIVSMMVLAGALIMSFVRPDERVAWLGAALASVPLPLIVGRIKWMQVARTSDHLPILLFVSATGVMAAVWEVFVESTSGWWPLSAALASAALFALYTFWYSTFGRYDNPRLGVGSKLPEFELPDYQGRLHRSADLIGNPAVLLFYRGNWCPLCMAQISEIAARYGEFVDLGINVWLISPQPDEMSRVLAERYDVPFAFLVDRDNELANELSIDQPNGVPAGIARDYPPDTVMPTLVVTGPSGTIVFSDQTDNYRVRPEPDVFLAILRRSGAVAR
ncbi:MAG: peroxiredoxin family protein [Woeseiaceae bacterium]|nr:peroxiredoxin family protein [Woeseiaceae bacterium]